ncbi:hypothetical protein V8F06_000218 [Rhypophila decipiens]
MSMSVDEIRSVLLLFSNPAWTNVGTIPTTIVKNITALSSRFSYSSRIDNITVLTSRYAKTTNGAISGFLYVPTLPADDPCVIDSAPHVPDYAVRRSDLPPTNYFLVALSPWISPECSRSYMIAARRDPVIGFIFYQTVDTNDDPPPPDSPEWDIEDGSQWMDESRFPVYAVSGLAGQHMMRNLSLYSGPMTAIPHGPNISDLYSLDPTDFVRVWTEIHVSTPSALPSLWVYALIIIGVLLVVITLTSLLMHFVQNRRRASLKRRVRAGQVNLEGMGIKRLTVPMEHIKSFPLYTYHYEPSVSVSVSSPPPTSPRQHHGETPTRRGSRGAGTDNVIAPPTSTTRTSTFPNSNNRPPTSPISAMFHTATDYQPMCDICLQQYRNRLTVIRELPCGHIFHPECIDEFLNQVSSLCPLCKACMLPSGYCPPITNIMVRRERAIRRLRDRVVVEEDLEDDNNNTNNNTRESPGRFQAWRIALRNSLLRSGEKSSSSSAPTTELQIRPPAPPPSALAAIEKEVVAVADPENNTTRSGDEGSPTDLARRRMLELAGSQPDDREPQLTRWQRIRRGMFPGF